MSSFSFGFEGEVDTLEYENYLYSVIYLPAEIAAQLPLAFHPRLRVEGEMNDYSFSGAFIPSSKGHHLTLGSARLKAMGLQVCMPIEPLALIHGWRRPVGAACRQGDSRYQPHAVPARHRLTRRVNPTTARSLK